MEVHGSRRRMQVGSCLALIAGVFALMTLTPPTAPASTGELTVVSQECFPVLGDPGAETLGITVRGTGLPPSTEGQIILDFVGGGGGVGGPITTDEAGELETFFGVSASDVGTEAIVRFFVGDAVVASITFTLACEVRRPLPPGFTKDDCKRGGWRLFEEFKNQGDCVAWAATNGRNSPLGLAE